MDRNTLLRWLLIAGVMFGIYYFFFKGPSKKGQSLPEEHYVSAPGFIADRIDPAVNGVPNAPMEGEICRIKGDKWNADLSSRGAALKHFFITDAHYAVGSEGYDISTTPDHERLRSLRTLFRGEGAMDQLAYDRFNWKLAPRTTGDEKSCTFTYEDATVSITKTIKASGRPFELDVQTTIKNLTDAPKRHKFEIGTFAFRFNHEVKGKWGRVSPFMTELSCANSGEVTRKNKDDFKEGWLHKEGTNRYGAVSNYYFGQALMPVGAAPTCSILAEQWYGANQAPDDDSAGAIYQARLQYPVKELAPQASATYDLHAYFGPKERGALAQAGGGEPKLGDLINLGFFSPVAKVLVGLLTALYGVVGNWGIAVILMTIVLRLSLFPLAIPQIKQSLLMRKLRPELDEIARKFKDDPQAKQMATMELHRKNGVNLAMGCLPQLVQMPVWWAMYSTLQTAVEMYHVKFLWFQDLSAPDRFFVLPLVLGGLGLVQAKVMPQQPGQDPQQQKMMMYMMPIIFTVMMLFLPAALGVYMTTNSLLGITQQLLVERLAKRAEAAGKAGEIEVKEVTTPTSTRKGKARV
ncbi:MAG: membrane protein insertase YidC [Polyangiaceae bacterium]